MTTFYRPGMLRGAGKAVALADAIDRGTQAVTDFQQGDNLMGGYNALRAGAGVMAAKGNPVAAAFLGGSMAGDLIGKALPEDVRMRIGAATNAVVRKAGDLVGQKWGVDDSALTDGPGASNTTRSPLKAPQAGRSTVLNASNYKDPGTPGVSAFDRTADVRSAINTGQIPDSLRDGRIWSAGNTYVGKDVRFGAPFVDAKTGMNREGRGNFNVIDNSAQRAYVQGVLQEAEARRAAEAAAAANAPRALPSVRDDSKLREDIYRRLERQPGEPSYRYRARTGALLDYLGDSTKDITNQRDNITSLSNSDNTNATARRGQDMSFQSDLMKDATARQSALRDQFNRDREFGLNLSREQRAAREESREALGKRLDTFATRMVDGKPVLDPELRARSEQAVNALLARSIDAALQRGDTALAAQIQAEGVGGIDDSLLRKTLRALELQDAAKKDDGFWWWKGDYVDSDNPIDFLPQLDKNGNPVIEKGFWGDNAVLRGGSRVDADYIKKYGGAPTRRYDNLN